MKVEKEKESKKELQITVDYEEKKLEAMSYFMEEKSVTIESAMQEHLNELYEKYVPSAMRRYLNRNDSPEQQQDSKIGTRQAAELGQGNISAKKREDRRQLREPKQSEEPPLAGMQAEEPAEENNQGMSMRM